MPDDTAPKSAYELAMERLKKKDAEAGVERQPVTDEQKAAVEQLSKVMNGNPRERILRAAGAR